MTTARDTDFLARMTERSHARVAVARQQRGDAQVREQAEAAPSAPVLRLSSKGFDLIAEVKRRSPALGELAARELDPVGQARAYARAGAAALSVLTEPEEFHGELEDLERVAAALGDVPAMRKDFLVDPYQVWEARAAGAGGVLLVAACLDADTLMQMLAESRRLGMFALVEAFDEADLDFCLPVVEAAGPALEGDAVRVLIGVNCRNLRSLAVDFQRFADFAPRLPPDYPRVAESGVSEPAQAAAVAGLGYGLALVGTALMRAADPSQTAAALLAAAREAVA